MLAPRWAHLPLSGEGAARLGGRWNARGVPALYMSEAFTTAVAEYEQELGIRPGTLCAYEVDVAGIADLRDPAALRALGAEPGAPLCPWKRMAFVEGVRPPTWALAERLATLDIAGALVPSARDPAGTNLVLWRWNDRPDRRVATLDPLGDLPRDQSSWPARGG